ncbi:MAG: acetyltransferase [bacterium]
MKVILIGGGGHSKVILYIIKRDYPEWFVFGYISQQETGIDIKYLGTEQDIYKFDPKEFCLVMAIGQVDLGYSRREIVQKLTSRGYSFLTVISRYSIIASGVRIGRGTVVMDKVLVNVDSYIGDFCILNSGCIVEHDCKIGDFVHIAPGAVLSGGVKVGDHCFIGAGSVVKHYTSICDNVIVGAGGVVNKDIIDQGTYVGVPVRKIK